MKNLRNSLNYINDPETKKTIKDILYKINIYNRAGRDFNTQFLSPTEYKYAVDLLRNHSVIFLFMIQGRSPNERFFPQLNQMTL